jgi:hypothetical protein
MYPSHQKEPLGVPRMSEMVVWNTNGYTVVWHNGRMEYQWLQGIPPDVRNYRTG